MKYIGAFAFLFLFFVFFDYPSIVPPPPAPPGKLDNPFLQSLLSQYESYLINEIDASGTPGAAVVIVQDSLVVYQKGFGVREINQAEKVDVHTLFRIGSLSKGFAGVLTQMLVADSLLNWNDRVVDYLPEFKLKSKSQTNDVTLYHLLSHTTGLPYHSFTNLVEHGEDMRTIAPKFEKVRLIGKPGEIYSYQNASFGLIDPIIEEATGMTFENQLKKRIFQPLGMYSASASYQAIKTKHNVAQPHRFEKGNYHPISINQKYYNAIPAGGVNASIADMAGWLQLLLGNRNDLFSEQSLEYVFKPVINAQIRNRYFGRWPAVEATHYAKGWRILEYEGRQVVYHGGFVNGFRGELAIDREQNVAICVLLNAPGRWANDCIPTFLDMYTAQIDSIQQWQAQIDSIFAPR